MAATPDNPPWLSRSGETVSDRCTQAAVLWRHAVSRCEMRWPAQAILLMRSTCGALRLGNVQQIAATDDLVGAPAEHALGAAVPGENRAVEAAADDQVVGRIEDGGQHPIQRVAASPLRDVLRRAGHAQRVAVVVARDQPAGGQPAPAPVAPAHAKLAFESLMLALQVRGHRLVQRGCVFAVHQMLAQVRVALELAGAEPEHARELVGIDHGGRRDVPVPQAQRGRFERELQALVALGELALRLLGARMSRMMLAAPTMRPSVSRSGDTLSATSTRVPSLCCRWVW